MTTNFNSFSTIGSDEVGTGDFFGPITVCAAYIDKNNLDKVRQLGLQDSKALTDKKICEIAEKLIQVIPYSVIALSNEKYNEVIKNNNMNKIKARLHNHAILKLIEKIGFEPELVLIDEFASRENYLGYLANEPKVYRKFQSTTKAESKSLAVAAASIIARYAFIKKWDELSAMTGFNLQKGASHLVDEQAANILKTKGEKFLSTCAKMNFKTLDKAKALLK